MVLAGKYYLDNQFTLWPTEHSTGHTSVPKTMNSQLVYRNKWRTFIRNKRTR
jgi:hypothetical protein